MAEVTESAIRAVLDGVIDPERFELFSGTISLPFPAGNHKCVAVKVIDHYGDEIIQVYPVPPRPYSWLPYVYLAYLAIAVGVYGWRRRVAAARAA